MKKEVYRKKFIIGFDETNNGYHLKSFNPYSEAPMIVTGYLVLNHRANYGSERFEGKGKLFNGFRNIDRALERGRNYIGNHPDFLYTVIPEKLKKLNSINMLKADAIALLTFEFFLRYNLNPLETALIIDEMDNVDNSLRVNYFLDYWLKKARINPPCFFKGRILEESNPIPYRSKRKADKNVVAVKKADTIGRYLGAINFFGEKTKWPYYSKKLDLKQLGEKCIMATELVNSKRLRDFEL